MTVQADNKPALLRYLEQVFSLAGPDVVKSLTPELLRPYLVEGLSQVSPHYAAASLKARQADVKQIDSDESLSDAQSRLRTHMGSVETSVATLTAQVHAETAVGCDVSENFGFSCLALELARQAARLRVYRDTQRLLDIVFEATGSAHLALATVRAEMVDRLVNSRDSGSSSEDAGASQALKAVINILGKTQ
jgi:hypothetical protein